MIAKAVLTFSLLLSCAASAQSVLHEFGRDLSCMVAASAMDVNRKVSSDNGYTAVPNGCRASVFELKTGEEVASFDIIEFGLDTAGANRSLYVSFYKDLLENDGKWTTVVTVYGKGVYIYSNGKKSDLGIKPTSAMPDIRTADGNLYMIYTTDEKTLVYLVRNNLNVSSTGIQKAKSSYVRDFSSLVWREYDPAGRSLDGGRGPRNLKMLAR